jgi:hypothetical protein
MQKAFIVALALAGSLAVISSASAQNPPAPTQEEDVNKKPYIGSTNFGFDPTVIQPGSHVFFADKASTGEIDIFKDGKLAVDLQLFGGDFVHYWNEGKLRVGANAGLGITQLSDASVLLTNISAFVQLGQYYRIDIGWMHGVSAKENLDSSQRDRDALFAGISFPTKLTEGLKKLLAAD